MRTIVFDCKLFIGLAVTFLAFTVVGTLSHECGHALVARAYSYNASVHYGYTRFGHSAKEDRIDSILNRAEREHDNATSDRIERMISKQGLFITWGGPLQTMLTGTAGLLLLLFYWKHFRRQERLNAREWLILFLALFWLRQLANFVVGIGYWLIRGHRSMGSDEATLEFKYHLPAGMISILTSAIALAVFSLVFYAVPRRQRLTFMSAGAAGGVAGYLLWLEWLGPVIMP